MPQVRRHNVPPRLLNHVLDCVQRRKIFADQLGLLAARLGTESEVPEGKWFKSFTGMTVCGEGELIKTFLQPGQLATGLQVP